MRATSLSILCGTLLYLQADLFAVKAKQESYEGLKRRGGSGSVQRRFLLQPMHQWPHRQERMLKGGGGGGGHGGGGGGGGGGRGGGGSSGGRSSSGSEGGSSGGASASRTTFMPASYRGPTTTSASGALTVKNGLTTTYPRDGVSAAIPSAPRSGMPSSPKTYDSHWPYTNTYPGGFTLLFIPSYSTDYAGNHWAVYDNNYQFYGFDIDDATSGDYDYEDGHDLPAGCQKLNLQSSAQPPNLAGHVSAPASGPGSAMLGATAPFQASAPGTYMGRGSDFSVRPSSTAPAPAPDAKAASAMLSSSNTSRQVSLFCKPIAAQGDPSGLSTDDKVTIGVLVGLFGMAILILVCVSLCKCTCKPKPCSVSEDALVSRVAMTSKVSTRLAANKVHAAEKISRAMA